MLVLAINTSFATEITDDTTITENNSIISQDIIKTSSQTDTETNIVKTATNSNYIFVNSTANNTNTGKLSNESTTLSNAIDNIQNNQIIYLSTKKQSDTYTFTDTIYISGSNNAKNITIMGQEGKTIIFDGKNKSGLFDISDMTITFKNIKFINVKSYSGAINTYGSNVTLNNCTFTQINPNINSPIISSYSSNIYLNNIIIENNTIQGTEGLIHNSYGKIEIVNSTFKNNIIKNKALIVSNNNVITIKNSVFDNNNGIESAIINSRLDKILISKTNFTNNKASDSGVIFSQESNMTISQGVFTNNTSENIGGAIVQLGNGALKITASTFNKNTAKYDGGAIYLIQSNVLINTTRFIGNIAYNSGGALYLGNNKYTGTFNISGNLFDTNKASKNADAIWTNYDIIIYNNVFTSSRNKNWIYLDENCKNDLRLNWWSTNSPNFNIITNGIIPANWRLMSLTNKTVNNKNQITVSLNKLSDSTTTTMAHPAIYVKFSADTGSFSQNTIATKTALTNNYTGNSKNINVQINYQQMNLSSKIEPFITIKNISSTAGSIVRFNISANTEINNKITLKVNNLSIDLSLNKGKIVYDYTIPTTWKASNYTMTLTYNGDNVYASKTVKGFLYLKDTSIKMSIVPINTSDIQLKSVSLPSSFDLRNNGLVSSVKVQGGSGSCWAFTSIASLESVLLKKTGVEYDLSENNMKNILKKYSVIGNYNSDPNSGNNDLEPISYLVGWYGPVNETEDLYSSTSVVSPVLDSSVHVQDVYIIPERKNATDNYLIKQAIYNFGAVSTGIYLKNTNSYTTDKDINHGVVIVGWDDNYSKNNFSPNPPGDGAFIVKNSWGENSGDDGYYYVSYYDQTIGSLCKVNDSLNDQYNYVVLMENNDNYSNIYQYDTVVNALQTFNNYICYKNVYTATKDENIAAVGTYFLQKSNYKIEIYVNNENIYNQTGTVTLPGYRTIRLNNYVQVNEGDEFTTIIRINRTKEGHNYVLVQYSDLYYSTIKKNQSFLALGSDNNWLDLYDYECVAPIKVYTKDLPTIKSTLKRTNDIVSITTVVKNLQTEGQIKYYVDGQLLKENGKTIINTVKKDSTVVATFNESNVYVRTYNIVPVFTSENYEISQNITLTNTKMNITKITVSHKDTVNVKDVITFTGTLSAGTTKITNANLTIIVNNTEYIVKTDGNGKYELKYYISYVGKYDVTISYAGNSTFSRKNITTSFTSIKLTPKLTINNISNSYYSDSIVISGRLSGKNDVALTSQKITLKINSKTYTVKTDNNGDYQYTYKITDVGVNNITASFNESRNYVSTDSKLSFNAQKMITKLTVNNIIKNNTMLNKTVIKGKITNIHNVGLPSTNIVIVIDGVKYIVKTDSSGVFTYTYTHNKVGNVNISIYYAGNPRYNQSTQYNYELNIRKRNASITVLPKSSEINGKITFTAIVIDEYGEKITGGNLAFKINGITLKYSDVITNGNDSAIKISVINGTVTYSATANAYIRNAKNITATYSGSSNYEAARS